MPAGTDEVLARELRTLVARLRGFSATRFAAAAPPFASRAEAAFHLVEALAAAAASAEGVAPVPVRRLGDHVLADQLAVVGTDLLAALARRPDPQLAAAALGELVLHRRDLDGSTPGPAVMALLAAAWSCDPAPGEVLLTATARCAHYRRPA